MKPIEKKILINAPISKVWKALTDQNEIKEWMFMPNNFKPELGNEFVFNAEMDGNSFDIKCKVLEIDKNKKLVYSWSAPFFTGNTTVSFQLKDNLGKTELLLIHSGWSEDQKEVKENHSKGWDLRVTEKLKELMEQN